jgi:hypothetical protein
MAAEPGVKSSEWMRLGGCEFYRIRFQLKPGYSKASDSPGICKAEVTNIHCALV